MTTIERRPNVATLVVVVVALMAGGFAWLVARSSSEPDAFWSADSRYAFYIQADHTLAAFDREERQSKLLGVNNGLALASRPN